MVLPVRIGTWVGMSVDIGNDTDYSACVFHFFFGTYIGD